VVRLCGLACGAVIALVSTVGGQNAPPAPPPNPPPALREVRIGFPDPMFKDVPKTFIDAAVIPFKRMIQKEIGMAGSMKICPDYADLAEDLKQGRIDLAVFHGFEYAWVKHQENLVPIVITNPSCGKVQACLVVHANCKAKHPHQLKGACVALPKGTKAHCTMYLKYLHDIGDIPAGDCCPRNANGAVLTPEEVLDEVVTGKCEAALVDVANWENYCSYRQGLAKQLKVLVKSEPLPPAVVVCRKGALTQDQMNKVRDGLLNCNKTAIGRAFTMFWQLDGFKHVSPDYLAMLDRTLKEYPAPGVIVGMTTPSTPMTPK
jgi:ABC-type phosphate/phosphonate transport system substrate-binding protein